MSSGTAVAAFEVRDSRGNGLQLAMQHLHLAGEVLPFGAQVEVCHRFVSAAPKPVEVVYAFVLPRDAALRRFRVEGAGFQVHSSLKPAAEAAEEYERGVADGSLSALARAYRDGLVNLSLGNLRPGEAVTVWLEIITGVDCRDDGMRFRFPFTLAPSYHPRGVWEWTGEGLQGELPRDEFGDLLLPPLREDDRDLHRISFDLRLVYGKGEIRSAASPSHPLRVGRDASGHTRVQLGAAADAPNRDLVLDAEWEPASRLFTHTGPDGQTHFAALIPSIAFPKPEAKPRRVVLLLDRSGSMQGEPLHQARQAVAACLSALEARDEFGLVAFDNEIKMFRSALSPASAAERKAAAEFLDGIEARGGTHLASGVEAAAKLLGEGGDVFVLTDGQVAGVSLILGQARQAGVRLHVLGIGSASQDRFLASLARETGGVSRFVTPRERVDLAAVDLFASACAAVAEAIQMRVTGGVVLPEPPSQVFAGQPLLAFGEFAGAPPEVLTVTSSAGSLDMPFAEAAACDAVMPVRGARLITETEDRAEAIAGPRGQERVRRALESLSNRFGLASQAMALVAVIQRPGDLPGSLPVTQVVPLGLPEDMARPVPRRFAAGPGDMVRASFAAAEPARTGDLRFCVSGVSRLAEERSAEGSTADLLALAIRLLPDGGMPGANLDERVARTLLALAALAARGHGERQGIFRRHVQRMLAFLNSGILEELPPELQQVASQTLAAIRSGLVGKQARPLPAAERAGAPVERLWDACRQIANAAPKPKS